MFNRFPTKERREMRKIVRREWECNEDFGCLFKMEVVSHICMFLRMTQYKRKT